MVKKGVDGAALEALVEGGAAFFFGNGRDISRNEWE